MTERIIQNDPFHSQLIARRAFGQSLARRRAWYADLTVTAASVLPGANAKSYVNQVIGETLTAGQAIYRASADKRWYLADANILAHVLQILAGWGGISLNGGGAGQLVDVDYEDDDFTPGATLSLTAITGLVYVLSATPGGIAPQGDLAAAMYGVVMGVTKSTTKMNLKIVAGIGLGA